MIEAYRCRISIVKAETRELEAMGLNIPTPLEWSNAALRYDAITAFYETMLRDKHRATTIYTGSEYYICDVPFAEFDSLYADWCDRQNSSTHTTGVING